MHLSIRPLSSLPFALLFWVTKVRAQALATVPNCPQCVISCVGGGGAGAFAPSLALSCNTQLQAFCAQCMMSSSSIVFGQATNSVGGGCGTIQISAAATIFDAECLAFGPISVQTTSATSTSSTAPRTRSDTLPMNFPTGF